MKLLTTITLRALLLLLLLVIPGFTTLAAVSVIGTSPTQGLLFITGATPGTPCQVEQSEINDGTYRPLVNDVDPVKYPGSNFDTRSGQITNSTNRLFLVGSRRYEPTAVVTNASIKMIYNDVTAGIVYTARASGVGGNSISIEYVVLVANQTLAVAVSGNAITITVATNSGAGVTSTASQVLAAVQANTAANALVSGVLTGSGAGMVQKLKLNLINGVLIESRALQQGTHQYYQVSGCIATTTGTYDTMTVPFGVTYSDVMSMTSTGAYLQPTSQDVRGFAINDSITGIQQVLMSQYSDLQTLGQNLDGTSGGSGSFCADDLSNSVWWHCAVPSHSASAFYLYGIHKDTGEIRFLGRMIGAAAVDGGEETGWAAGSANTLYYAADISGHAAVMKWNYTGNDVAPSGPDFVAPADAVVDITGGNDLTGLVRAFNSNIGKDDLVGTVTTSIPGGSCGASIGAGGSGVAYTVNWVSGSKFLDGSELIGQFITINGVVYIICDSTGVPTQTQLHVYDRYALSPAANTTAAAYRFNMYTCAMVGVQANAGMLKCTVGAQDSPSWQAVFSFGNGVPVGTGGSTAGVIAAMLPLANPISRWSSNHTYEFMGESTPIYAWQMSKIFDFGINSGPYQVVLGTNLASEALPVPLVGYTPVIDTNITITSASLIGQHLTYTVAPLGHTCDDTWVAAEAGWVDGMPLSPCYPHYIQDLAVGDVLAFVTSGYSITEFVQIVAKHDATHYDIQRGTQSDSGMSPTHTAGERLTMWSATDGGQLNPTKGFGWAVTMWDYVNAPNGTESCSPTCLGLNWGIHATTRGPVRTATAIFDNAAGATNKANWGRVPPYGLPLETNFNGAIATASGNWFQKHPAMASGTFATQFDVYYFVGTDSRFPYTRVGSFSNVWKVTPSGPTLAPKLISVLAKTKFKNLIDVSAPGRQLSDADDNVWCATRVAEECAVGSVPGEVYAALSTLDSAGGNNKCTGGENGTGAQDLCIANFASLGLSNLQQKFLTNDVRGYSGRRLTSPWASWEEVNELDGNLKLTYDGKYGIVWRFPIGSPGEIDASHGFDNHPAEMWAIKIPVDPGDDGIDRTKFIQATVNLTAPGGLSITKAQVKFWYDEWGGTLANPYCTSRREGCVAVKNTLTDATGFCSFANACPVDVTSLGLLTPYSPADNPMSCVDATGVLLDLSAGFDTIPAIGSTAGVPLTQVRPFYSVNSDITCTIQATAFSYMTTEAPTPVACATTCSIKVPVLPLHTAKLSAEFMNASGTVVATSQGMAVEGAVMLVDGVAPTSTTTTLISSTNPSVSGGSVTFTASITPSSGPTGTVAFKDSGSTIATITVSSGSAAFTTSALSIGSHTITAVYSGDSTYASSTSSTLTQVVNSSTPIFSHYSGVHTGTMH